MLKKTKFHEYFTMYMAESNFLPSTEAVGCAASLPVNPTLLGERSFGYERSAFGHLLSPLTPLEQRAHTNG